MLPGQTFSFALNLFSEEQAFSVALQKGVELMAALGFGPARSRCILHSVHTESRILSCLPACGDVNKCSVVFQSPTELKDAGHLVLEPDFGPLFRRICDRISTLQRLYASSLATIDSADLTKQAEAVQRTNSSVQHVALSRRSSRTGQEHPLGGFIGWVAYEGIMTEFIPYLRIGEWTGVGRQTTWGKGEIRVEGL